jgi:protein-disulfide isomerase
MTRRTVQSSLAPIAAAVAALVVGCTRQPETQVSADAVVAVVDDAPITAGELDRTVARQLAELDAQMYDLRRQKLDEVIGDRLIAAEAQRRGMAVNDLLDREVDAKAEVTEAEIDRFVEVNRSRWTGTDADLRSRIREELESQRHSAARDAFVQALQANAKIDISLPLPTVFRFDVPIEGAAAARGPAEAPVTIVEFTDFHCPYCKAVQPTLAELERRYGRYLRFVQHDLPIDRLHPQARIVHEAARCADEQGRFWDFRARAFAVAPATPNQLSDIARDLGMNVAAFAACRAGTRVREAVTRSLEVGSQVGVASTPAFFINGRQLLGAQPIDRFVRYIDAELRNAGVSLN